MASSFSYQHLTEEEKQRILMGGGASHMNGPGPFGGTPNIASVNKVPMIGGGGMPSSQQN